MAECWEEGGEKEPGKKFIVACVEGRGDVEGRGGERGGRRGGRGGGGGKGGGLVKKGRGKEGGGAEQRHCREQGGTQRARREGAVKGPGKRQGNGGGRADRVQGAMSATPFMSPAVWPTERPILLSQRRDKRAHFIFYAQ